MKVMSTEPSKWTLFSCGLLLGVGLLHPLLWPVSLLGLWLGYRSLQKASVKDAFWFGWWFWFGKYLAVLSWGWHTFPLVWLGDFSYSIAFFLIFLYWLVIAGGMAIAGGIFAIGLHTKTFRLAPVIATVPVLWVFAEALGGLLYSVLLLGPGTQPNIDFSFGHVGYALAGVPILENYARVASVYTLSLVAVLLVVTIDLWLRTKRPIHLATLIATLGIGFFLAPVQLQPIGQTVATIDTRFSASLLQTDAGVDQKVLAARTAFSAANVLRPDIIIFPEDTRFLFSFHQNTDIFQALDSSSSSPLVVDSSRVDFNDSLTHLRGFIFDPSIKDVHIIDKAYLTPQGEFMPYVVTAALSFFPESEWKRRVNNHLRYRPSDYTYFKDSKRMLPSVLFCMEKVSPFGAARALNRQPAQYIVHPVSMAWFENPVLLNHQLAAMLTVNALHAGVPIVVAANESVGYVQYPDGRADRGTVATTSEYWTIRLYEL